MSGNKIKPENKYHGKACKKDGHGTLRYALGGSCVACVRARATGALGTLYRKSWKGRYTSYKTKAKQRGYAFELTLIQFGTLCLGECYYCGEPATGVDRIDSSRGYEINNCRPCCGFCNIAKSDKSTEEFLRKIELIHKRFYAQ